MGGEEGFHQSPVRNEALLQRGAFLRGRGQGRTPGADGLKAGAAGASGIGHGSSRDSCPAALQLVLTQH